MSDYLSESAVSAVLVHANLTVLWDERIVKARDCKMCGGKSCDESPIPVEFLVEDNQALYDGRLPWLHYVQFTNPEDNEVVRTASGRCCLPCFNGWTLSGLSKKHASMKAYLDWKAADTTRHGPFLRVRTVLLKWCQQNPGKNKLYSRSELSNMLEVYSRDETGLRATKGFVFIELETWREENPGKEPPQKMIDQQEVENDEGEMEMKTGVWVRKGKKGHHDFERYRDKAFGTKQIHKAVDGPDVGAETLQNFRDAALQQMGVSSLKSAVSALDLLAIAEKSLEQADTSTEQKEPDTSDDVSDAAEDRREQKDSKSCFGLAAMASGQKAVPKAGAKAAPKVAAVKVAKGIAKTVAVPASTPTKINKNNIVASSPSPSASAAELGLAELGQLDGRLERMLNRLREDLEKVKPELDAIEKSFTIEDEEDACGGGAKFQKCGKDAIVKCGTVTTKVSACKYTLARSKHPHEATKQYEEAIDSILSYTKQAKELWKMMSKPEVIQGTVLLELMTSVTRVNFSQTWHKVALWRKCEDAVANEKFEEALALFFKNNTEFKGIIAADYLQETAVMLMEKIWSNMVDRLGAKGAASKGILPTIKTWLFHLMKCKDTDFLAACMVQDADSIFCFVRPRES